VVSPLPIICTEAQSSTPQKSVLFCRRCYELQCKPATFEDGLNITNNAQYACLNTESIVVKIVVRGRMSLE